MKPYYAPRWAGGMGLGWQIGNLIMSKPIDWLMVVACVCCSIIGFALSAISHGREGAE